MRNNRSGLYIHIPFCKKKCGYCDFYSVNFDKEAAGKYVDALIEEYKNINSRFPGLTFDTVYLGGGTPSLLPLFLLEKLTNALYKYGKTDIGEFTIEVNPCSADNLPAYKNFGVNRISLGVQSLDNKVLAAAGRLHTREGALYALSAARDNYDNVSADIILGLPYDTIDGVKATLDGVFPYVNHISMYILKLSDCSPMAAEVERGVYALPGEDIVSDMYDCAFEHLKSNRYKRYEISNFAYGDTFSRHNMKYWTRENYIGLGAAAHSFIGGVRYDNPSNIERYLQGENLGSGKAKAEVISPKDALFEEIMLSLRLEQGIDINKINKDYNIDFLSLYDRQIRELQGILVYENGRLFIREDKMLLESAVAVSFL